MTGEAVVLLASSWGLSHVEQKHRKIIFFTTKTITISTIVSGKLIFTPRLDVQGV